MMTVAMSATMVATKIAFIRQSVIPSADITFAPKNFPHFKGGKGRRSISPSRRGNSYYGNPHFAAIPYPSFNTAPRRSIRVSVSVQ